MGISLNMIVGGFYEPFLEPSIRSIYSLCDEFIIIDTAPGDNPNRPLLEKLAREYSYPAFVIYDLPRGEDFNFGQARELARERSTHEWVLRLDADECISEEHIDLLKMVIDSTKYTAIAMQFYHFMVTPKWHYPEGEDYKTLFFKKDLCNWVGKVHEQIMVHGDRYRLNPKIRFFHYGYLRGQEEVFKRWLLYESIEKKPAWFHNCDPEHILDERLRDCVEFKGKHPKVVQQKLEEMFKHMDYRVVSTEEVIKVWAGILGNIPREWSGYEIVHIDAEKITLKRKDV